MDCVVGNFDINLVGNKPFVHRDPTSRTSCLRSLQLLKENFPRKQLYCATDSYITETPLKIYLADLFQPTKSLETAQAYVSHVFHKDGNSVDPELDCVFSAPECLGIHAVERFRIKRLVAGPFCTGTALHQHSRAYFHNIIGVKRWFLASPSEENSSVLSEFAYDVNNKKIDSISDWFRFNSSNLCKKLPGSAVIDLNPGDSLYIPDGYYHAVLNMTFTVGIAFSWEKKFQVDPSHGFSG